MKSKVQKSIVGISLLFSMNIFSSTQSFDSSRLIVKMKVGHSLTLVKEAKSIQHLFGDIYILTTDNLQKLEASLKNNPNIVYIQKSYKSDRIELPKSFKALPFEEEIKKDFSEFNDPLTSKVWSFNDASKFGVSVNQAYQTYKTTSTNTTIVAVVDTGIDYNHEDLKDIVWTNSGEIAGNGIDDDNNGYIDDVHGINTLIRDSKGKATVNNMDTHSHGTHVSGTIAAKQNNGIGISGIASNVKIMGLRTVPNNGDETDIDVAEAFIYAAKNGAKIINCSFGKSKNEGENLIPDTLKFIGEKYGVLVIAAAGNDSEDLDKNPSYPAAFTNDNLLVIASTTNSGSMSGFSNFGKVGVDVAAPGSNIYSSVPGNKYEYMSGTSMATPTTVGVAAEVLSHFPNLTYRQLKEVLMNSVSKVDKFKNKMVSGGRIDLNNALAYARTL
jgi:thermitase